MGLFRKSKTIEPGSAGIEPKLKEEFFRFREIYTRGINSEGAELQAALRYYQQKQAIVQKMEEEIVTAGEKTAISASKFELQKKWLNMKIAEEANNWKREWEEIKRIGSLENKSRKEEVNYFFYVQKKEQHLKRGEDILMELNDIIQNSNLPVQTKSKASQMISNLVYVAEQCHEGLKQLKAKNFGAYTRSLELWNQFWEGTVKIPPLPYLETIPDTKNTLEFRHYLEQEVAAIAAALLYIDTQIKILESWGINIAPTGSYLLQSRRFLTIASKEVGQEGFVQAAAKAAAPVYFNSLRRKEATRQFIE